MMGTNRSISRLLLTVGGTAGIAALFLPFTYGVSPTKVVADFVGCLIYSGNRATFLDLSEFFLLAIPFFLSVLVSAAYVRWMISGLLSRPERAIAYVASSMMAFSTLYFNIWITIVEGLPSSSEEWLTLAIPLLALFIGVYFVIKKLRNKGPKEVSAIMAMQIAYLYNALFCLPGFFEDWQIGAYCVVVASSVYLLQIVLAVRD